MKWLLLLKADCFRTCRPFAYFIGRLTDDNISFQAVDMCQWYS